MTEPNDDDPLVASLRRAVAETPDNVPLRVSLARLLASQHRHQDAEQEWRAGLERTPEDPELTFGLAETFYALGRFSAALVLTEKIAGQSNENAQVWLLASRCHHEQEEHRQAAEAYRRAKSIDPQIQDDSLEHYARGAGTDDKKEPKILAHDGSSAPRPFDAASFEESSFEAGANHDEDDASDPFLTERPKTTFDNVGGMEAVKDQIRLKIIHPLEKPELFAAYGKKVGGGILLYGPPGCGKTLIARATAGEVDASFLSVGIADVLDPYIGQSERNMRDIFEQARAKKPTVIFFDECDALAASRRDMRQSAGRQVINQFLSELDGLDAANDGLLVIGATNAPWHLDPAFRRPGRFDRIVFIPPPDLDARIAILRILLAEKPAGDVDIEMLAKKTPEFSGADLQALVDVAIEEKLTDALRTGRPEPLTTKGLVKAAKKCKPTTREWFTSARNHALYANADGLYDDVLTYLGIRS